MNVSVGFVGETATAIHWNAITSSAGLCGRKAKKYGLKVYLCGDRCHRNGTKSVHRNSETMLSLHQWGQRKAMMKNNWTIEEFRQEFHKNYLEDEA